MRKIFMSLLFLASSAYAGGNTSPLTVSSGTFKPISLYSNDDGGNRQAIVIGDSSSSDTVRVSNVTGMRVHIASGTASIGDIGTVAAVTGITNALPAGTNNIGTVTGSTVTIINPSGGTLAVSGTVSAAQSGAWTVSPGTGTYPIQGAVTQSGAWTVNPGTGTYPIQGTVSGTGNFSVGGSTVGVVGVGGTYASTQSGAWTVSPGTGTYPVNPYVQTTISDGLTLIPTAGTRVVLAASTTSKEATICSHASNTGVIAVGGTTVVAALATQQGVALNPGDCYTVRIDNLNDINVDATVSGSTATWTYVR